MSHGSHVSDEPHHTHAQNLLRIFLRPHAPLIVVVTDNHTTFTGAKTMTTTAESPPEALARIQSRVSQNDFAAIHQFAACGISPDEITPRENVLTFKAWKAMNRRVAKGATGQKVCVWVPVEDKKTGKEGMRPITAVLFHVTQTIAEDADKGTRPAAWQNPQLVKAGTYDETGNVIKANAVTPLVTSTPESEAFEASFGPMPDSVEIVTPLEVITVTTREELAAAFEAMPSQAERAAQQYAGWSGKPAKARQLAMF